MDSAILAYIDPGTGSIILQMLIGSVVGGVIMFRQSIARVVSWFRSDRRHVDAVVQPTVDDSTHG